MGRLTRDEGMYRFVYTRGAETLPNFRPFGRMSDLHSGYRSEQLFPVFANRVLAKSRPEYSDYLEWLGLSGVEHDALDELARTGGLRATDSLEIVPCPEPTPARNYEVYFFCRGLRYQHPEIRQRALQVKAGERLYLMHDLQNPHDEKALLMRTDDPITVLGYTPRYYSAEFSRLVESVGADQVQVTVERVNTDAPEQYRLLCRLVSPWPANFSPCNSESFQLLA